MRIKGYAISLLKSDAGLILNNAQLFRTKKEAQDYIGLFERLYPRNKGAYRIYFCELVGVKS